MKHSKKLTKNSTKRFSFLGVAYSCKIKIEENMSYDTKNDTPSLPMPLAPRLTLGMLVRLAIIRLIAFFTIT